jgi:hypothetical protein
MLLYFEYEEKRRKAEVAWPKNHGDIVVHVTDKELAKEFPTDLHFEIESGNRVVFTAEDIANKRLLELQNVISRRLQELVKRH